jgi:hypothetical protein
VGAPFRRLEAWISRNPLKASSAARIPSASHGRLLAVPGWMGPLRACAEGDSLVALRTELSLGEVSRSYSSYYLLAAACE